MFGEIAVATRRRPSNSSVGIASAGALLVGLLAAGPARGDEPAPAAESAPAAVAPAAPESAPAPPPAVAPAAKPAPSPYSLPWQLRPAIAPRVLRSDTSIASFEDTAGDGQATVVSYLLAAYRVSPSLALAPLVRLGIVGTTAGDGGVALTNLMVGALYAFELGDFRLAPFVGLGLPTGMGGGNDRSAESFAAVSSGVLPRTGMDAAMFMVNDLVLVGGVDFAWLWKGLTIQLEANLLQFLRVRGDMVQPDEAKTNFNGGLHVGYFIIPQLSVAAELRYQRWIVPPEALTSTRGDPRLDILSLSAGVRGHFKLGGKFVFRPGLAYTRGIDDPMWSANYHIVQIDLPLAF